MNLTYRKKGELGAKDEERTNTLPCPHPPPPYITYMYRY